MTHDQFNGAIGMKFFSVLTNLCAVYTSNDHKSMYGPLHHCGNFRFSFGKKKLKHLHLFVIVVDKNHFRFLFSSALLQFVLDLCVCVCVSSFPFDTSQRKVMNIENFISEIWLNGNAVLLCASHNSLNVVCVSVDVVVVVVVEKYIFKCIFIIGSKLFKAHEPYICIEIVL